MEITLRQIGSVGFFVVDHLVDVTSKTRQVIVKHDVDLGIFFLL